MNLFIIESIDEDRAKIRNSLCTYIYTQTFPIFNPVVEITQFEGAR